MASEPTAKPTFLVNLPTTSLPAATAFLKALNFTHLTAWSDSSTTSFLLPPPNQSVGVMLHAHARMKDFIRPGTAIADARATTAAVYTVMAETREEVDRWMERVERAGGKADPYVMQGLEAMGMYVRSWEDPVDGHLWEVCAMVGGGEGAGEGEQDRRASEAPDWRRPIGF
ncbi:hypothetical protein VTK26DRAFT_3589 [Humicola hyalothermophila]